MTSTRGFKPLPTEVDLPAMEREILARWEAREVFRRSLEKTKDGPRWIFYEGPPTANGKPGAHHVEARVFKDLFPRFKTMKGFNVPRRAGWDCHGLPVELAVEKELGFSSKQDIEDYGIAEFNAKCRESALSHVAEFEALTRRMGYWVDLDNAYLTMSTSFVESVWWSLKTVFDAGRLVEDYRVTPFCPHDETPLSDHEVAQGYALVTDPSVYVTLPLTSGLFADRGAALLVWTTTPWTLVSNTAVAINPDLEYVLVKVADGRLLVMAETLVGPSVGDEVEILEKAPGTALVGATYTPPFDLVDAEAFGSGRHRVVPADYVTADSGTGLVHLAPAFGAEDWAVAKQCGGLNLVNPITSSGRFTDDVPLVGGVFFKDADDLLVDDLRSRGRLLRLAPYEHSYPSCWRCHTPLIYYALPSWYIRTTAVKDEMLAQNEVTGWYPAHIKHGRYGAWLTNNIDWALSRNRYWGTPLPVWRCTVDAHHLTCVGSLAELSERAGRDLSELDPHRPYVDEIEIPCQHCGAVARRVPEVIDCWYDSGAMPFAQWGAPHRNAEEFEASFPAQFICEAIDQTRGWFYSLMAVSTLLYGRSSYENVLCLGLILDAEGRKMSKHLGNIVDPHTLFDKYGADAVRWLMLGGGSPWADRRLGDEAIDEIVRKVLLTYWNTASFFTLYADANSWQPDFTTPLPQADRPVIDRWILAELHITIREVDAALEGFDSHGASRRLAAFIDILSNWYVRRCRRRFWRGEEAAFVTLYECLETLTRLLAPFIPFLTEYLWQHLCVSVNPMAPESVHLADWPVADETLADERLREQMGLVQRIVELGRATRSASKMRTRQPLARAMVAAPGFADLPAELRTEIAQELNVAVVEPLTSDLVVTTVKPNWRALGARFGKLTPKIAAAVPQAGLPVDGRLTVTIDGASHDLTSDDLVIVETPKEGWAVTTDGGLSVALDLELTDELRRAGLLRDVLRVLQEHRKVSGLEVSDRIDLWWEASRADTAAAIRAEGTVVAEEVLALSLTEGAPAQPLPRKEFEELGLAVWMRRAN
ncbi:MAG: isoleucine--tRNA ligase [Micromonosporaceae bacterium]|nr:isoleucine--tRNA ligase [Micromonosporaceae bacterium]